MYIMIYLIIFTIAVFLIEMAIFYCPLYFVSYGIFKLDKKIGDKRLSNILIVITVLLSVCFLNKIGSFIYSIFF